MSVWLMTHELHRGGTEHAVHNWYSACTKRNLAPSDTKRSLRRNSARRNLVDQQSFLWGEMGWKREAVFSSFKLQSLAPTTIQSSISSQYLSKNTHKIRSNDLKKSAHSSALFYCVTPSWMKMFKDLCNILCHFGWSLWKVSHDFRCVLFLFFFTLGKRSS